MELEEQPLVNSAQLEKGGPAGSQRSSYVVTSLTLRFEYGEVEQELKKLTAEGIAVRK